MDPVLRLRNDLFREFYHFFCEFYASRFNKRARGIIEACTLIAALLMVFLWAYAHFVFVKDPENCIPDIGQSQSDVIIQIEVYRNSSTLWNKRNKAITRLVILNEIAKCNSSNISTVAGEYICASEDINSLYGRLFLIPVTRCSVSNYSRCNHVTHNIVKEVSQSVDQISRPLYYLISKSELFHLAPDYTLIEFVQESGYLQLTEKSRQKLNIIVEAIHLDPNNETCFGNIIGQFLLRYILGYNVLIYSSLKNVMLGDSGYLHDVVAGNYYWFRFQSASSLRYLLGVLPTIFFTLLVSTYVRQCHFHFFKLLYYVRNVFINGIVTPVHAHQVSLLLITYASVGLVVVICEALDDSGLFCLMMLLAVIEADHFYAVFCRSDCSKKYWPRFFYLYHFLPYAYYTRFHGQFVMMAFFAHWLLVQHSMLYFFHHYELPRVEHHMPRVPLIVGGHQLIAILHTPIRPFPHISLAVFASNDYDSRRIDEDISDDDANDAVLNNSNITTTVPNSNSSTTNSSSNTDSSTTNSSSNTDSSTTNSSSNTRNRFYHNSDTLLRRPL